MVLLMLFSLALVAAYAYLCFFVVQPYSGVLFAFLGIPTRGVGPGPKLIFWPFERPFKQASLLRRTLAIKLTADTKDEEVIHLDMSAEYEPAVKRLKRFFGFESAQIETALTDRIRSLTSIKVRGYKDHDEVMDHLSEIGTAVMEKFKTFMIGNRNLEAYYGVKVHAVLINDPELPAKLTEAEVERKAQEKINEKRRLEMGEVKKLAQDLVKQAAKNGQDLDFRVALKIIQTQLGIIKESTQNFGLTADTSKTAEAVVSSIVGRLFKKGK
ncbi:MAG: hypothetical protein HYT03_00145 [Candidatus Harrisonbacteria bacterium]|nr:hypothetical protein [Candidatus Harrisonbacteria bacterium]